MNITGSSTGNFTSTANVAPSYGPHEMLVRLFTEAAQQLSERLRIDTPLQGPNYTREVRDLAITVGVLSDKLHRT